MGERGAVAESAFNRELLFKARHGLRQKKKKKTTLKVDQLFSIGLLLSFLAATPSCPYHLVNVSQLCRLTETSAAKCLFHSNFNCFCL